MPCRITGPAATPQKTFPCRLAAQAGGLLAKRRSLVNLTCIWQTWQRPTLPCLQTKYHRRRGVSRPSSEWDRVQPPRNNHQVGEMHVNWSFRWIKPPCRTTPKQAKSLSPRSGAPAQALHEVQSAVSDRKWPLVMRTIKPIELLVLVSFTHYCASTPSLSTW